MNLFSIRNHNSQMKSNQAIKSLIVLLSVVLLVACAGNKPYSIQLMARPDVYEDQGITPFTDTSKISKDNTIEILYATDREPAREKDKEDFYQNKRGAFIRLGKALIQLGGGDVTWEELKRVSMLKNRTSKFPLQVTATDEYGILDTSITKYDPPSAQALKSPAPATRFATNINNKLARSKQKDIYIYVPGFKVVFENPLLVASELWHYMGYEGVFVAYSWPSTPSLWAYFSDTETTVVSARSLRLFITYLAKKTRAEKIHIIGYSAGTRVVTRALGDLALIYSNEDEQIAKKELRLGHVILVGSDLDRDIFLNNLMDGILDITDNFSVYVSEADKALGVSKRLFGHKRLGMIKKDKTFSVYSAKLMMEIKDLHFINVTDAEGSTSGNGHAYFRKSPWASSDILVTLLYDIPPVERGLMRTPEQPVWTFPPDYMYTLRSVLADQNPDLEPLRTMPEQ